MAEYSKVDVGLSTVAGNADVGSTDYTDSNRPTNKPIFTSSILETELVQSLFFVVDLGEGKLMTQGGTNSDVEDTTTNTCTATIWSKFGSDWLKFHVGTGLFKDTSYVVSITPNTPGSQVLELGTLLLSGSLTPVIGSRTYIVVEPQVLPLVQGETGGVPTFTGGANPDDTWEWIDGGATNNTTDTGKQYGYQYINSITAYLLNPE